MPEEQRSYRGWWIGAGVAGVVVLVLLVVVPNLLRSYLESHAAEAPPVTSLRAICTANAAYGIGHPEKGYAASLRDLGDAGLIDPVLAKGEKRGYRYEYFAAPEGAGKVAHYRVTARPATRDAAARSFFLDDTCVLRSTKEDRAPTAADPPLQ